MDDSLSFSRIDVADVESAERSAAGAVFASRGTMEFLVCCAKKGEVSELSVIPMRRGDVFPQDLRPTEWLVHGKVDVEGRVVTLTQDGLALNRTRYWGIQNDELVWREG